MNGISEFNSNKELEKVAIVVLNSELKPLEKFVLEIHKPDISQNQVKHNKRGNCTFYTFISFPTLQRVDLNNLNRIRLFGS